MTKKKTHKQATPRKSRQPLVFEELEPRLLLSADLPIDLPAALAPDRGDDEPVAVHEEITSTAVTGEQHSSHELVFVDTDTPDYLTLVDDLLGNSSEDRLIEVVLLDNSSDGIAQITDTLSQYKELDAVHIISHGSEGAIDLGGTQLEFETLLANTTAIQGWAEAFSENGDLLIYGCNLAASTDGQALVDSLARLTGADVAASDDLSGSVEQDGDWELEYEAGDIETEIAFSDLLKDNWQGTLDATAQAAAEEQQAEEEQQQQQQAQTELEAQQAALKEEEQAAAKQGEGDQQAAVTQEQRLEIVIIDESVNDFQSFIDDLQSDSDPSTTFEIVLLDNDSGAVERINEMLSAYQDVDALHILSHGDDGTVKLGDTWLNADNLDQYSDSLSAWGDALDVNADLLIYGCNLAESVQGETFISQLAQLTGADVAASDDLTGHASLGGDWNLEYTAGQIETAVFVGDNARHEWSGLLAETVYTSYENVTNTIEVKSDTNSGQTFSYTSGTGSYNVNQISLQLNRDTDTTLQNITVSLRTSWDGADLATATISSSSLSTSMTWESFDIGNVTLNDGQTYYIRISTDSPDGKIWLGDDTSGSYANGDKLDVDGSPLGGEDLAFRVIESVQSNTGTAIWGESGSNFPEYRAWDGTSFGAEGTAYPVGQWRIMQGEESPQRDEKIVIGVDSSGNIEGMLWDGSTWSQISVGGSNIFGTVSQSYWWGFDVQYESQSGDALMVWNDGSNIEYATWDGTSWSSVGTISSYGGATPRQLQLAASPDSDEMVLVVSDSNSHDFALVWDGSSWGNAVTLSTTGGDDRTDIFVAYEQQSGDAMVVYGKANIDAYYRTWDGTSWSSEGSVAQAIGTSGNVLWSTMASDPNSDRIALGVLTSGGDVWFNVWDGGAWATSTVATTTSTGITELALGVAFESTSGDLLATYGESGSSTVKYMTWSAGSGWSAEQSGPNIGGVPNSMTLSSDPTSDRIMLSVNDDNSDVNYVLWDGGSWGTPTEHEIDSGETKNQPFLFLWDQDVQVNDAPVNTVPATQNTAVDTPLVFSTANGNLISVADTDDASIEVTLAATSGALTLNGTTGLSFSSGDGSADASMTFTGTIADIDAALEGLQFDPTAAFEGFASVQISTTDFGGSGAGSPKSDVDAVTIEVGDVNTAPVNAIPSAQIIEQDGIVLFSSATGTAISVSDVDAGGAAIQVTLTATNGTINLQSTQGLIFSTGDGSDDPIMTFTGTVSDINAALDGLTFVATPGFTGTASVQITTNDLGNSGAGGALSDTDTVSITVGAVHESLQLSTIGSATDGATNWNAGDLVDFGDPGLAFEPGTTAGTFTSTGFSLDSFAGRATDTTAIHVVGSDISVGSNAVQLYAGDLLLASGANETLTNSDSSTTVVATQDIFVFRPDTPGDYSSGSFFVLITGADVGLGNVTGVTLVEQTTVVGAGAGSTTLQAGDFLIAHDGVTKKIELFDAGTLGATTTGSRSVLVDGADINIGANIHGVELIETSTTIGGVTLQAGQILVSLAGDDNTVGNNAISTTRQDVFTLDITQTGATTVGDATLFLQGNDTGLDAGNNAESVNALSLRPNLAPVFDDATLGVNENSANGTSVGSVTGTDPEGGALNYAILGGNTNGAFAINVSTGEITVANSSALDFESTPVFILTVAAIDDSGAYTSATVTINLNNVDEPGINDAPFNTVPGAQTIDTNGMLLFSSATGTALSVNDFDAGGNAVQVTLKVDNGTLNLPTTSGLTFSTGDGSDDPIMTFTGTIADINAALEGATFVATAGFTGTANVQIITDDLGNTGTGGAQSDTDSVSITVSPSYQSLLLTTTGSATSDAGSGSVSWNSGDMVELGDPGLTLEPVSGTTSGTFSSVPLFSLDAFAGRATNLNGIHYVTGDIAVGTNSLQLQAGDILFVTDASETLTNSDLSTLSVTTKDIVAFRPTTSGDYSSGDFFIVVRGADIGLNNITAFSLVEQDTVVGIGAGSTTLNAGEFIVVHDGARKTLQQLTPGVLGGAATNTGTTSLLVDGADINIGQDIYGLELIESDTTIGGVDLQAGQILVTLKGEDSTVGDNSISTVRQDIFLVDITQTGASTVGDATLVFEGNDVGLDAGNNNEDVWGIGMAPNQAPTVNDDTQALDENSANGTLVTTVTATDPENGSLTYAITAGNTSAAFAIDATTGQITVANSAALDFETTPSFTLTVAAIDAEGAYNAATVTVNLNDVNEAPVLDSSGDMTLSSITEDQTSNAGNTVAEIIASAGGDRITDPDAGALEGIAVTGLNSSNGTWQYSINGGGSWLDVGTVSDSSALLLRASDQLRFVPDALNADSASVTFRAWDQTAGTAGSKVDASSNGGMTAFSSATESAAITVTAVNDAPSGAAASLFSSINEDNFNSAGKLVSAFTTTTSDPDSGALKGIAVIEVDNTNGEWQYSLDGSNWFAIGDVTESSARLLAADATTRVRFVPDADYNGTVYPFKMVAWDQTTGTAGALADASARGGTTAFSSPTTSVSIGVDAVNDAPTATASTVSLAPIAEDTADPAGATISSLFGAVFSDAKDAVSGGSSANSLAGVVIVGNAADAGTEGAWQWFDGSSWQNISTSVSTSSGLGLSSSTLVRLLPNADYSGAPGGLTVRLVEDSAGAITSGSTVNVTVSGGTTRYSDASNAVSLDTNVTPVNDSPTAVNDAYTTNEDTPFTATLSVNDLLQNDSDIDGDTLTVNTTPVVDVSNGTLVLNVDGTFTYTPTANFNGSDSFTYEVSDGNGGTAQATVTITVDPVNDTPTAVNDAYTTNEDTPFTATLGVDDLLQNDADIDGDTLTVNNTPVVDVSNGTLVLNADGTFTYTPTANFSGSDSFTYEVSDGNGGTVQATVTLMVDPINDNPVAVNDSYTTNEDTAFTATLGIDDLLQNDSDLDGDSLTVNTTPVVDVSNGTLVLNADGTFTYTPTANFNGTDSFTYEVSDGNGGTAQATVTLTVDPVNDNPTAVNDSYTTNEDTPFTATLGVDDLLQNDSDIDGDTLTVNTTPVVDVSNGTLVLNVDGTFTYTPTANFNGSDSFTYEVSDGNGGTAQATVTITVDPVNDTPTAVNDSYTTNEDTPFTATLGVDDLLQNDADIDGDTLTVNNTPVVDVSNGTLVLNADGTFTYTPTANFNGTDSFTYEVSDGNGGTAQATVTLTVDPVNDNPTAVNDSYTTNEDTAFTATLGIDDLLQNDSDLDGDSLTVNTTPVVDVSNGTLVLNADGTFTYTPTANFNGTDSFTYEVSDGNGGTAQATVTLTVDPVNDTPTAVNDAYTTNEDTAFTATLGVNDLLLNDSDLDGDTLTVNTTPVVDVSNGTLVLNADGTFTYTPTANFNGTDSFTYEVSDGNGGTAQATVTLTVDPVNDNPTAVNDSYTTNEDTPFTATLGVDDLLQNDSDLDGDSLTVNTTPVVDVSNGTLVLNADGTFTYTPTANFNGSDSFTYEVSDGNGGTAQATVTITVDPVNDNPTAVNDSYTTNEDTPFTVTLGVDDLLQNDSDLDGDTLTVNTTPVVDVSNGTLVLNADGTFTYTPTANFNGTDSFTYELSDGNGGTAQATVAITVDPVNDNPTAVNDSYTTNEDTPFTVTLGVDDLLQNDSDLDGDTLTVNTTPVVDVSNGTLVMNADGTFTYTPTANFNGTDSFTYELSDGNGGTAQATVTLTVDPVNDTPTAVNDAYTTNEDTPFTATLGVNDLLLNDSDLDGDTLTVNTTPVVDVSNGTLVLNADGTFTYTPTANFNGTDSFTYEISDGNGGTAQATVTITVDPVTDLNAADDAFSTNEDTVLNADVSTNDSTTSGGTLSYVLAMGASNGSVVVNTDGTFTYTPGANYTGADSFTYTVTDADSGESDTRTVSLTINPVADLTAQDDAFSTNEDTVLNADVSTNDSTTSGGTLSYALATGAGNGSVVVNTDGTFTYTPGANYTGADSFTYTVTDADSGESDTRTVSLTINPVADLTAQDDTFSTNEDTILNADVSTNDSTTSGGTLSYALATGASNGSVTLNGDGTFTYTPTSNYTGADSFTYTVTDADSGESDTRMVSLTVDPVNDTPNAVNDAYTTNEETPITTTLGVDDLLLNDSDLDGDSLTVNTTPVVDVSDGTLVLNADGTFTYTPTANFNGSDSFTYEISDGNGGTAEATVTITVDPVNDNPTAVNDSYTVNEGSTTNLNLAANDTDADDGLDLTSITIVSGPTNGSLVVNADGTVDYSHDGSETVADSFTYTINDASGATSAVGTVNLTIDPVNDAPIHGVPAAQNTSGTTPLVFSSTNGNSITVADPDAIGAPVEVTLSVSNGTLSLAGTSGLSFNVGDGSGDATMTFTGTATAINAALNGLSFQADADYEGMAEVQIITDDLGNAGTGGALNALDRVYITVTASAPAGSSQDTLPTLDELILEDMLDLPAPVSTSVNRPNVVPAAEGATEAVTLASASATTQDAAVDAMLGSGRGVPTQADVSLPGSVQLFDQNLQPHDDDRPSSVRLIGHVIRQGLVDPFTYAKMLNPLQPDAAIWESIEAMMEQMSDRDGSWYSDDQVLTTTTATGLTVSFTVGYVSWLLRAGYLSASLLSVVPLWREFDPLPVLATIQKKKRKSAGRDKDSTQTNDIDSESIFTSNETV